MYYQICRRPLAGSVILIIDTFVNKTECSLEKTIFGVFWNNKWLHLALCLSNDSVGVLQMNAETFTSPEREGEIFSLKKLILSRLFGWSQLAQRTSFLKALRCVIFVISTFFLLFVLLFDRLIKMFRLMYLKECLFLMLCKKAEIIFLSETGFHFGYVVAGWVN